MFQAAADIIRDLDPEPTRFDVWTALYARQREWAADTDHLPLLWSYGVSLIEQALLDRVAYVEQPLAWADAFTAATKETFDAWDDAPPVIIDESDDRLDSAGTALQYGYAGTSHKNCKGEFEGIANACLIAYRDRIDPDRRYVISAEDLTTVGPIELLHDLAVTATIGAEHVERNGHHYFRGLSAFPAMVQETLLEAHGDLYRRHENGFVTLDIDDGRTELGTTVDAPFGVSPLYDTSVFTPLDAWLDTLGG